MTQDQISIHKLVSIQHRETLLPGIEHVFFESSAIQSFDSDAARAEFRERWLGRYLTHDPDYVYVALLGSKNLKPGDQIVVGYLVGALDDPAQSERFSDLGFFQSFRAQTARYPAQLHVNVLDSARGKGIGRRLIEMFVKDAVRKGVPGIHVVTSAGARNISFYKSCGFDEVATTDWNARALVFLGRPLAAATT